MAKNIFINPTFNGTTTFNSSSKDGTSEDSNRKNRLLSYEIQDIYKQMNCHVVDKLELGENFFIIEQSVIRGIEKMRILVKCLFKNENINVSKDEIQVFDNEFNRNKDKLNIDKGFLVTNTEFENQPSNIRCITQDELSKGVLNIKDSLKFFCQEYEKKEIYQRYIELSGKIKENNYSIVEYLLKETHEKNALYTIFGDFGTGKSTILNRMCYEISNMYLSDKSTKKPLLLELKDFYNNKDIVSFVNNAFRKQYHGIEFLPELIMNEVKEGRFFLFLDGFDEMSAQISVESRFENFNKLSDLLKSKSVCILTCRSSYFITHEEYRSNIPKLFSQLGTFQSHIDKIGQRLDDKYIHNSTLDYNEQSHIITNNIEITINPLTEPQIKIYFEKCSNEFREKCNSNVDEIYNFIKSIYDLGDLITKPILLSIITDTILLEGKDYLKSDIKHGHSALYKKYTELILKRDWEKGASRRYLSMKQRSDFAEVIATTMLYKDILEIKYDDIISLINTHKDILPEFKKNISDLQTQEFIASDIRVCSFLKGTDENTFKFVHKSFMEFFVAQLIVKQLMAQDYSNILSEKMLNKEILFFIGGFGVYREDIQEKIFSIWRNNNKTKNQILKRNLYCAFILSRKLHNNYCKNTFNISDVNIEAISIRKIGFRSVEYNEVNFVNTDFYSLNIDDSKFSNTQIETFKINDVKINHSIFQSIKLHNGTIEASFFNLKEIIDFECKELISINAEYNFSATTFNIYNSEYQNCKINNKLIDSCFKKCYFKDCPEVSLSGKNNVLEFVTMNNTVCNFSATTLNVYDLKYQNCKIKNELTDSNFKRCSFKDCPEVFLSGKNNVLESVTMTNIGNLIFQGCFKMGKSKIVNSTIEINDTIKFSDCEFKNCKLVGNGVKNLGQFNKCKFDDCLFIDFYIEYDSLFDLMTYQKKEKKEEVFKKCEGIILTNKQVIDSISPTLLVFNVENYQIEINNYIKQKEESIKKWEKQETERKAKLKQDIEQIRLNILSENDIKNKKFIDKAVKKKIDDAIKEHKDNQARVNIETFNEKKEYKFITFLKFYQEYFQFPSKKWKSQNISELKEVISGELKKI